MCQDYVSGYATAPLPYAMNWEVRPMRLDDYFQPVFSDGVNGLVWNEEFQLDVVDNGAFRINVHSDHDGIMLVLATGSHEGTPSIDPITIVIDMPPTRMSEIRYKQKVLTRVLGATFPRGKPAWVWVTYVNGLVCVGFGRNPGENQFMQTQIPSSSLYTGGYNRFAVGKTGNTGAFEAIDLQPLRRNKYANVNLRGTGYYE